MRIYKYDHISYIPKYPEASKGYRFEIFSAKANEFEDHCRRWDTESERLAVVQSRILADSDFDDTLKGHNQFSTLPHLAPGRGGLNIDGVVHPYRRDLCGLSIEKLSLTEKCHALDHCSINYSRIQDCNFNFQPRPRFGEGIFFDCSIQYTSFSCCLFSNVSFWSGICRYIVFRNCEFRNVYFNVNGDGQYENIIFHDCVFDKCQPDAS